MQSVPKIPLTRCTDVAPTGSSIPIRSNVNTASTTTTPAILPMITELQTETNAQAAVIATKPARQPFSVIPKSGFPNRIHAVAVAVIVANAAAVFVVTAT